jgi:C4-dicarboxylate-binding protein DctP
VEAIDVTERTAAEAVGQLREKGMQLHIQTDAEAAQWRAAMQRPVIDAFLRAAPEGGQRIIDLLNAIPAA